MIYLFYGSDTEKVRAKAFAWVAAARAKQPEAPYLRIDAAHLTESALAEAAGSQGLFFSKSLVLVDDPFSIAESGRVFLEALDALITSDNPVAVLSPKLLAAHKKKLESKATKVFSFDLVEKKASRGFNSGLVNALAARDRAGLWKELMKAERAGDAPEMLHGLLHWKARDLLQKGSAAWGRAGARKLSRDLIELLSDSRSGELGLKEGLERFVLSM